MPTYRSDLDSIFVTTLSGMPIYDLAAAEKKKEKIL